MIPSSLLSQCAACPLSRRRFLRQGSAAAAGALNVLAAPGWLSAAEPAGKTRIRILYALHAAEQPGPDWPNKGFDFKPVMERVNSTLTRECAGFEFVPSLASGPDVAKKILAEDQAAGGIDGYLVYQMNAWNQVVQTMATSGKPVLYADFQYGGSGGFLVYNAAFLRNKAPNVGFVSSSATKDLVAAVKCFQGVKRGGSLADFVKATAEIRRKATPKAGNLAGQSDDLKCLSADECLKRLKESRILAVRDETGGTEPSVAGITVEKLPFAVLNDAWAKADKDESRAVADRWQKGAQKVEGVSRETLETSAAMYLGMKALLKKHNASGITVNCLGGFYGNHIHAYPCLGFHELCNEGLVGGCECDVRSAATMWIGTTLTQGRPGYISDPVIDTAKRQIIYAHCVASNKAFGPQGKANPFQILTHSEDRQGASVRSLLPTGYLTTTVEFDQGRKQVLFHLAKAVGNDPDDRACRTKLCAEPVGDLEKLFKEWDQWGWHRVTFYGNLKEPMFALADKLGWKVVEEA
jgi:hypothetical protein